MGIWMSQNCNEPKYKKRKEQDEDEEEDKTRQELSLC